MLDWRRNSLGVVGTGALKYIKQYSLLHYILYHRIVLCCCQFGGRIVLLICSERSPPSRLHLTATSGRPAIAAPAGVELLILPRHSTWRYLMPKANSKTLTVVTCHRYVTAGVYDAYAPQGALAGTYDAAQRQPREPANHAGAAGAAGSGGLPQLLAPPLHAAKRSQMPA